MISLGKPRSCILGRFPEVWCILEMIVRYVMALCSMSKCCRICHEPIGKRRLEALPNTQVCVKCSDEPQVKGFMTWEHKTAPTLNIVNQQQHEQAQSMQRRGFHAHIGANSYNNPRLVASVQAATNFRETCNLVRSVNSPNNMDPSFDVVQVDITHPRATCHPDRPKASSDGKCLECALAWYSSRLKR